MISNNISPITETAQWSDCSMSEDGQHLWRINNEYRLRLSKAQKHVELLTALLQMRARNGEREALTMLEAVQAQLARLGDEHRDWRYRFYYESNSDRRMVQDERAVHRALAGFSRMYTAHQQTLHEIAWQLHEMPRPTAPLTAVAGGDLWELTRHSITDLASFDGYLHTVVQ
jgi:hypothetical protein